MKRIVLALLLVPATFVMLTGCASSSSSTSADMPPPENATADASGEAAVVAPVDTGEIIPLSKLPTKKGYPYAIKTKWADLVKSPYAQDKTLVEVKGIASGNPARCPHTGKIFIVP